MFTNRPYKYWAFLSYSSKDRDVVEWFHRRLESYPIPEAFRGIDVAEGMVLGRTLRPVFRDRDELTGAAQLGPRIEEALSQSLYLIVLCSPNSASSVWVNREIESFQRLRGEQFVLALIIDGEPNVGALGVFDDSRECFPPALRYPAEPLAGDLRSDGDGKERGFLKILAGVAGLDFDDLYRRHERAERKRRVRLGVGAVALMIALGGLAGFAFVQRGLAKKEAQRALVAEGEVREQLKETRRQLERSWLEEGRAWLERARFAEERGDQLAATVYAGRAVGYTGYGRLSKEPTWFEERYPRLLGGSMSDVNLERERHSAVAEVSKFLSEIRPTTLPVWTSVVRYTGENPRPVGVSEVRFSPDGSRLISIDHEGFSHVWSASTGAEIFRAGAPGVSVSPDARRVAIPSDLGVFLQDLHSGEIIATLEVPPVKEERPTFSPSGNRIAVRSLADTLWIWEPASSRKPFDLGVTAHQLGALAPRDFSLATIPENEKGSFVIWDAVRSAKEFHILKGHDDPVGEVIFDSSGGRVASRCWDDFDLKVWDVDSGEEITTIEHDPAVTAMTFSSDGVHIASGGGWISRFFHRAAMMKGYQIKLTNLETLEERVLSTDEENNVRILEFSPDGSRLASSVDGVELSEPGAPRENPYHEIKIWDVATGEIAFFVRGHVGSVSSLAFSPDGNLLASGSDDGTVKVWDLSIGADLVLREHPYFVTCVAFHPEGSLFASGSIDGVRLWDLDTGRVIQFYHAYDSVSSLSFSPDGKLLAVGSGPNPRTDRGSRNYALEVIESSSGARKFFADGFPDPGVAVAFSPDSRWVVAGDAVFDVETEENVTAVLKLDSETVDSWLDAVENDSPVSANGRWRASFSEQIILIEQNVKPGLDLASWLRIGAITMTGSQIEVPAPKEFEPMKHVMRGPLALMEDSDLSSARQAEQQMRLYARSLQESSAAIVWNAFRKNPQEFSEVNDVIQALYLKTLLAVANLNVEGGGEKSGLETASIIEKLIPLISAELMENPVVSLEVANLLRLLSGDINFDLKDCHGALESQLLRIGYGGWLRGVRDPRPELFRE